MRIYPELLVDQEFKALGDQGFMGTLNDRQFAFLRSKGYVNALPDMMTSWLSYSPANLFALNEPGIWLDPSDVANLDWRRNLLEQTNDFTVSPWAAAVLGTSTRANTTSPYSFGLGLVTVTSSNGGIRQSRSGLTSGQPYTLSFYLESAVANINVVFENGTADFGAPHAASINPSTGAFSSVSGFTSTTSVVFGTGRIYTLVSAAARGNLIANIEWRVTAASGTFLFGRPQFEAGSVATDYQRISDVNTEVLERFPRTTMFQDRAGSTAVTTPGQSVGLRLDKSKGLVLGSELVTNGDFSGGSTGWTVNAGWTITGGAAVGAATSASLFGGGVTTTVAGRTYRVDFDVVSYTSGNLFVTVGGNFSGNPSLTGAAMAPGRKTVYVIAGASPSRGVEFYGGNIAATIDNISVKELPGNHAVANSDAARGIYGIEPLGGRRNLLTFTEQFDNAAWTKDNITVSANASVSPDGATTADKLIATAVNAGHGLYQGIATVTGSAYTLSAYLKSGEYAFASLAGFDNATFFATFDLTLGTVVNTTGLSSSSITAVGNGWYRCTISRTATITGTSFWYARPLPTATYTGYLGDGTSGILVWGAQLETGSTATAYQRVTTQYDVTEAGKQTLHYVQYDGSDDGYVTPTISPESGPATGSELVTNGEFDSGTTGWTAGNATLAVVSGALQVTGGTGGNGYAYQALTTVAGTWYKLTFSTTFGTETNALCWVGTTIGGSDLATTTWTTAGQKTLWFRATGTLSYLRFGQNTPTTGLTVSFDNISVRSGFADKVQVFAGVRKLSDAASGALIELSAASSSNNGSFFFSAPPGDLSGYFWRSKGTSESTFDTTTPAAPSTDVLTGIGDIAGDLSVIRIDGVVVGTNTADQGTGNFLAYPLYIGRRGGTTLPFNGRDYGIITRFGANLDASTIAATESWLNQKTGAF